MSDVAWFVATAILGTFAAFGYLLIAIDKSEFARLNRNKLERRRAAEYGRGSYMHEAPDGSFHWRKVI